MYDTMRLHQIDSRENKGVRNINSSRSGDNGVFMLDEEFSSGYHIYIPYGISEDLLDAINTSIIALEHQSDELQKAIDSLNGKKDDTSSTLAITLPILKEEFDVRVKVLRAFAEIPEKIRQSEDENA